MAYLKKIVFFLALLLPITTIQSMEPNRIGTVALCLLGTAGTCWAIKQITTSHASERICNKLGIHPHDVERGLAIISHFAWLTYGTHVTIGHHNYLSPYPELPLLASPYPQLALFAPLAFLWWKNLPPPKN